MHDVTIPTRVGRPLALTLDAVVHVAMAIADMEGLSAVTFQRLADELGVGVATVVRRVGSRRELHELLVARVLSGLVSQQAQGAPARGWKEALEQAAMTFREAVLEHPALIDLFDTRVPMNHAAGSQAARFMGLLLHVGMSPEQAAAAYYTFYNFVTGQLRWEVARLGPGQQEQFAGALGSLLADEGLGEEPAAAVGRYMRATSAEEQFLRGLRIVLTGIEAWVA
jgi:AcrR family transcriptional regulator